MPNPTKIIENMLGSNTKDLAKYLESIHAYLEYQLKEMKTQTELLRDIKDSLAR